MYNRYAAVRMFGGCADLCNILPQILKSASGESADSAVTLCLVFTTKWFYFPFSQSQQYKIVKGALMGDGRLLERIW